MPDETAASGELVRIDPKDTQMALVLPNEMAELLPQVAMFSPLAQCGAEGKIVMYRAMNEECRPIKDFLNVPIRVVNFLLHTVRPTRPDENGEITPWVRAVLVLDDGTLVDCGSKGVIKGVMSYHNFIRRAPWNDHPLACTPVAQQLGEGRQWYTLKLDAGQLTPVEKPRVRKPAST